MPPYRKCLCCGKMFAVCTVEEIENKKYCSRKCSVKYRRRLKRMGAKAVQRKELKQCL